MDNIHNIKIQDKEHHKVARHQDRQEVKIMGNMGSSNKQLMDNKLRMDNKQLKDMDNKWVIPMETNNINNINNKQHKEVMDNKVLDNRVMVNNSNTIHMVWVIQVKWDSQDKSKCRIMELHHNHNLMDLQDKKIHLKMLKLEKYLLVVLVEQLSKTFTIISRNLDQSKIMWFKEIQWQVYQKVLDLLFSKKLLL